MGTFNVQIEIGDPDGQLYETVEAMVDSGAAYTFMPPSLLRRLGVQPHRKLTFMLADGTQIERDFGWTRVRLNGDSEPSPVVFGDEDAAPLLGTLTLTIAGLALDPESGGLVPAMHYLPGLRPVR